MPLVGYSIVPTSKREGRETMGKAPVTSGEGMDAYLD